MLLAAALIYWAMSIVFFVSAKPALRARIVKAVLSTAGRLDIPVGCGVDWPLVVRGSTYWGGWEGDGILGAEAEPAEALPYAVDLITDLVLADPPWALVDSGASLAPRSLAQVSTLHVMMRATHRGGIMVGCGRPIASATASMKRRFETNSPSVRL